MSPPKKTVIAVAIPCYEEANTIGPVVADFRRELPDSEIIVFDNNCTDCTAEIARLAGASVIREKRQGKGFVIASIFAKVDADIIVMVDGDDTYDASAVHRLLAPILAGDADTTAAARLGEHQANAFRKFHKFGNHMLCRFVNWIFKSHITDIFTGYRAFTRECARSIPITAGGFDVEVELTLQALYRNFVLKEIAAPYKERPVGSFSKLRTYSDGFLVIMRLASLFRTYKPLTFFGGLGLIFALSSILAGILPVLDYVRDSYVRHVPLAVLAASLMILSSICATLGLILNTLNNRLRELERITILHSTETPGRPAADKD
jgi:glycosyltransferase involved in cell wall biosynthesis